MPSALTWKVTSILASPLGSLGKPESSNSPSSRLSLTSERSPSNTRLLTAVCPWCAVVYSLVLVVGMRVFLGRGGQGWEGRAGEQHALGQLAAQPRALLGRAQVCHLGMSLSITPPVVSSPSVSGAMSSSSSSDVTASRTPSRIAPCTAAP